MDRHTIKQDLEQIERNRENFKQWHPGRQNADWNGHWNSHWPIPLSVQTTSAEMAALEEAEEAARTLAYARTWVAYHHPPHSDETWAVMSDEDREAYVLVEFQKREADRIVSKMRKEADLQEQLARLPQDVVEFNFVPLGLAEPDTWIKELAKRKLSNQTVIEVLKSYSKGAEIRVAFDETHRVLRITCDDYVQDVSRIALNAEQDEKKINNTFNPMLSYTPGTFNDILKGKVDAEKV